jgi:hypothetical protein
MIQRYRYSTVQYDVQLDRVVSSPGAADQLTTHIIDYAVYGARYRARAQAVDYR